MLGPQILMAAFHGLLLALRTLLIVATVPLVLELLVTTVASFLPARENDDVRDAAAKMFRLAVIVPAHNEEKLIGRCVASVRASDLQAFELFVVAHNCTDKTGQEAQRAGARVLELNDSGLTGKGAALQHGFDTALQQGFDAVFVVDADSVLTTGSLAAVGDRFVAGARAVQCRYQVLNARETRRTQMMALALSGFNVVRPRGRARLGCSAGIFGNGFGLHRETLEQLPYTAFSVVEDLEYHLQMVRRGMKVEFIDHACVLGEMPTSKAGSRTQRSRWEGGRLLMARKWSAVLAQDLSRGHFRVAEPLLDLLSLPLAFECALLVLALLIPDGWLRWYALCAVTAIVLHVTAAVAQSGDWRGSVRALVRAPGYIVWKIAMIPGILRNSREGSPWIRTGRDVTSPEVH